MIELDFELPFSSLNDIMDVFLTKGALIRWVFYQDHRDAFAIRALVPEIELEETLLEMAGALGEPLEVSILPEGTGVKLDQAFLTSALIGEKRYPIVVLMHFETNPRVPDEVQLLTRSDSPKEIISSLLKVSIGPFSLSNPDHTRISRENGMTRVVISP